MTSNEAMDLCAWEFDLIEDDFVRFFCFLAAVAESQGMPDADCETLAQECIDDPSSGFDIEMSCEVDPGTVNDLPACAGEVTVGELENCIEALAAVFAELADNVSCENLPIPDSTPPAACLDLEEQCPELFDFSDN